MAVILSYHRVAPPRHDPFGLCVTPSHFEEQIEHVRRNCLPLPLLEFAAGLARGDLPDTAVAVTIDDGYTDALTAASPTLARFEVPATFFVTTAGLDGARAYWWDVLAQVLIGPHDLPPALPLPAAPQPVATGTAEERDRALKTLHAQMLPLPRDERDAVLARIVEWSGLEVDALEGCRPMTGAEITALGSRAGHAIGSHSANHLLLPSQPPEVQGAEVRGGKASLERLLEQPVDAFCYPFGAWDETTRASVREAGFRAAVTVREARADAFSDPLLLPRVEIGDCDGQSFAQRLRPLVMPAAAPGRG